MSAALKPRDFKSDRQPIWCPGCGDFGVLNAITKALAFLERSRDEVALISGIGCSSRIPAYLDTYGFHGLHGRALPIATGLKVARPELTVIATGGDGDGFSIGGNHFLHACRRNTDITYVVMDNEVCGMTKGQASPTTHPDWRQAKLTPGGTQIPSFDPCGIALAAGASFVARGFSGDPNGLAKMITEAIVHPGFSFLQVLSPCPTYRPEQKEWKSQVQRECLDEQSERAAAAAAIHADNGFSTGIVHRLERPVWPPAARGGTTLDDIARAFSA
ncbi:MAG: 2-oxoacid:ferredoxin oxidoreductase subunit beta [Pseudomonadota bacterium]